MAKRRFRFFPRYSLRVFLLASVICGVGTAWVSHIYAEYRDEQKVLKEISSRAQSLSRLVNGEYVVGVSSFM